VKTAAHSSQWSVGRAGSGNRLSHFAGCTMCGIDFRGGGDKGEFGVLGERDAGRFERGWGSGEPQQCDRAVAEQAGIELYVEVQRAGDTKAVEPGRPLSTRPCPGVRGGCPLVAPWSAVHFGPEGCPVAEYPQLREVGRVGLEPTAKGL
jgi:hypothetical protein